MNSSFMNAFQEELRLNLLNDYDDNYDHYRYGKLRIKNRRDWKSPIRTLLRRAGIGRTWLYSKSLQTASQLVQPILPRLEWLYEQLGDESSKKLLVKILSFRALGHRKVKLPLSTPAYWEKMKQIEEAANQADSLQIAFMDSKMPRHTLRNFVPPLQAYLLSINVYTQFVIEQYQYASDKVAIEAQEGDYVVDAGACWGDTALYFAQKVGSKGKVFSWEFIPSNLSILRQNLALNPGLNELITVVEAPLWSSSQQWLYYVDKGPGSHVSYNSSDNLDGKVETRTLDEWVSQCKIPHVDFIKMDIEGAELEALKGAAHILKQFRPKLAISIYHRLNDFVEIPEYIASLNLGYRFYLKHATIHREETVLFAHVPYL